MLGAKLNKLIWKFSLSIWERGILTKLYFTIENAFTQLLLSMKKMLCLSVQNLLGCRGWLLKFVVQYLGCAWELLGWLIFGLMRLFGSVYTLFIICTVLWGPLIMLSRFLRKKHHHLEVIGYFMSVFFWTSLFIKESYKYIYIYDETWHNED